MMRRSSLALILLLPLALATQPARAGESDPCVADAEEPARTIRVAAVGGIMMGTTFPEPILPPAGASLSPKCPKPRRAGRPCYLARAPPGEPLGVIFAVFEDGSLANNHALDF